jgi:diaminopimelate epimerase
MSVPQVIPFVKAHGARNDFLLTWRSQLPAFLTATAMPQAAIAICHRHTGVGADGWMLMDHSDQADVAIELWNSDGSRSEMSGNGTRCAAALMVDSGRAGRDIRIQTGAGPKHLALLNRKDPEFSFEMNMGQARVEELDSKIVPDHRTVILNVGNPQCAVFVKDFAFDWRALGETLERHPRFPNRTNVSFIRVIDQHTLDVRFWERGAGETMSSGTGSTGAAAAAVACGFATSPVRVETPAGPLDLRWQDESIFLTGPAEIIARGEYIFDERRLG